ncbi:MAG: pyruvate synthase subunit beta, partial [Deltaproteobacteria bacterium]|nr:pyruvate synthase subunit beta [Deltaproteobacteria bacterium]
SLAHPEDTLRKFSHALQTRGFRFLHILAPCPTGWKSEPAQGIQLVRLAVQSGLFPVCEIRDGVELTINIEPDFSAQALNTYLSLQGRFRKSAVASEALGQDIQLHWQRLRKAL